MKARLIELYHKLKARFSNPKDPAVRITALIAVIALVCGALFLVLHRDIYNLDFVKRWMSYRHVETTDTGEAVPFTHAGGDKGSLAYLESGVLHTSTAGAHYYSITGEKLAENVLAMDNPVLNANRSAGVAYDAGGQALYLFRDGTEALNLTLEDNSDLLSARVNEQGWLAVTAQESGYKGAVTIYDDKGEKVIKIGLSSTFVVDAILSPDCKTVAVITMGQKGSSFSSQLLFYPVNKTEPSRQVDLDDMVVLDLEYEDDRLWVLGEDRLGIIPTSKRKEPVFFSFGRSFLKGCHFGGDGFAMLLTGRYRSGSATDLQIITPDGEVLAQQVLDGQVLDFTAAGNYCAVLSGSHLDIYSKRLAHYDSLDSTQGARYAALAPDASVLLGNDQRAWLYLP